MVQVKSHHRGYGESHRGYGESHRGYGERHGMKYHHGMPLSYPEPTIQEEVSPSEQEEAPAVISSAKASSGQGDTGDGGSGSKEAAGQLQPERRPRSGTWSVANSRRLKIKAEKEEDASLR